MSSEIITTSQQPSAISLIREAMASGAQPEYLRELLAVRREWEADEARKLYSAAVADFQARCPVIEKADKAYDKEYARMDRIWRTIRPLMSELGLSVTWQISELRPDNLCHVEGKLGHKAGHSERITYDVPLPEIIKGQNRAQQMGSAVTYARRYATCGALGIQTGKDDDGNGAGTQYITSEQADEISLLLDACRGIAGFDESKFWKWVGVSGVEDIALARFADAKAALQRKIKGSSQ